MNTVEILDLIQLKLQDDSYSRPDLLASANQCLLEVSGLVYLPVLQKKTTVSTVLNDDKVSLPDIYFHGLFQARNKTKDRDCNFLYNRNSLIRLYNSLPDEGDVEAVTTEGSFLYYRLVPAESQDLEIQFYGYPVELLDTTSSSPTCIPEPFHKNVVVNYVLADKFSEIEDGAEGQKVNTQYYEKRYIAGVSALNRFTPDVSRPRRRIPRKTKYF